MSTRSESRSMPPARFAAVSLATRLTKLVEEAERCAATPDPDAVHDLRVAIRRFSQALRIFRTLVDAKAVKQMRRALKRVMDAAAAVRDLDVGMERLIGEGLPPEHAVLDRMRSERRRGEMALCGWLLLLQSEEPESAWRPCLEARPAKGAGARARVKKSRTVDWNVAINTGANARHALPGLAQEFFALGRAAAAPGASPAELHAFRLAAKRFRYTLELFLPLYGPRLAGRVDQVRKIQSLLGDRQDCVVLGERLKKEDGPPAALHATLQKLNADGSAIEEKFRRHWHGTFDAAGEEAAWTRYLSRRQPAPRSALGGVPARLLSGTAPMRPQISAPLPMQPAASGPPENSKRTSPRRRALDLERLPIHK